MMSNYYARVDGYINNLKQEITNSSLAFLDVA